MNCLYLDLSPLRSCMNISFWTEILFYRSYGFGTDITLKIMEANSKCLICGKKFKDNYLTKHVRVVHQFIAKECPYCDKKFTQGGSLRRHIVQSHNIIEGKLGKYGEKQVYERINCERCDKEVCKYSLTNHIRVMHEGVKVVHEQVNCDLCGKLLRADSMKRHLKSHENRFPCSRKKSRKCIYCDANFKTRIEYIEHLRSNHPKKKVRKKRDTKKKMNEVNCKKFHCSICQKSFHSNYNLKNHIKQSQKIMNFNAVYVIISLSKTQC